MPPLPATPLCILFGGRSGGLLSYLGAELNGEAVLETVKVYVIDRVLFLDTWSTTGEDLRA